MSAGTVPTGNRTYLSTIAAATTAETITFADRYQYLTVANLSGTGGQILYVTTDGSTPVTAGASNTQAVMPGERAIIANELAQWYQSQKIIAQGGDNANGRSLDGQAASPGTKLTLLSPTLSLPYAIEVAG